ncbi:SHOCT domain-containing protein [Planococcus versutus]|uniref:SHOCT domain-containing protein n=1 Tax=Planococcus versutus TaxID=1302659 RepID=A0A1B1RZ98_9BACL|nr:SHOCT domain-containing protein [Planococcus versutus]ANU26256.1 hypothetical protein I858_004320 [Planococcus versutus]
MMRHGSGMDWGMGGGFLMFFLLLVIVGAIVYYVMKNNNANRSQKNTGDDAMEIAKKRLAKGEITTEEFEEIKKTLL